MSSQKNSQRRSQSSTRNELARDLHDSLAQDLVAIGYSLDLLISELPVEYRSNTREIRFAVSDALKRVRRELFALRSPDGEYFNQLNQSAEPLQLLLNGDIADLDSKTKRIVNELVKNAAAHSKGHVISVEISRGKITVKDDGHGLHGVSELVEELGGTLHIDSTRYGTRVEIELEKELK